MSNLYAQDTFLTGGRGMPNAWSPGSDLNDWVQKRGVQLLSFSGTQGILTYNASLTTGVLTYSTSAEGDTEVFVNAMQGSSSTSLIGAILHFIDLDNWYFAGIGNTPGTFEIIKDVANTFTSIAQATFASVAGTKYSIRFNIIGTTLKAKIWQAGTSEPSSWTIPAFTDTSLGAGLFGVAGTPAAADTVAFDTFSAVNPSAPSGLPFSAIIYADPLHWEGSNA